MRRQPLAYTRLETDDEVRARVGTESIEGDDLLRMRLYSAVTHRVVFLDAQPMKTSMHASDVKGLRALMPDIEKAIGKAIDDLVEQVLGFGCLVAPRKLTIFDLSTVERRLIVVYPEDCR